MLKPVDPNDLYQMLNKYLGTENLTNAVYSLNEDKMAITPVINVLLADDNKNNQQLIRHFISSLNASITMANNGQEAIGSIMEKQKNDPYDVVLMDLHMPVLDGVNATMILRDAGFNLPIIAFTANAKGIVSRASANF